MALGRDSVVRAAKAAQKEKLQAAVHRHRTMSRQGLLERCFTLAFRGLVYPQIWEDPRIDMEALAIDERSSVVAIASGGCNVMSYLTGGSARITAIDLNAAHVALNRLKLAAARHLPGYTEFHAFFGDADRPENLKAYREHIRPHLDIGTRTFWESRDIYGRRRIHAFARGLYRAGLLGHFIGLGHLMARLFRRDPRQLLRAQSLEEQRAIFDRDFAPLFRKPLLRLMLNHPASLFGLGIPPAQYNRLVENEAGGAAELIRSRLERLACGFDLKDNYFAWQAFGRRYDKGPEAPLPPYLQAKHFDEVRARVDRVDVRHGSMTEFLADEPDASHDRYILLDAQDWMTDTDLTRTWREITRTARPGARVIFRTAAEASLLPGRIPNELLARWTYDEQACRELTRRDRSSLYGGFHLYALRP